MTARLIGKKLGLLHRDAHHHRRGPGSGRQHVIRRFARSWEAWLARDNYLPHLFAVRGDRLVYLHWGLGSLTIVSGTLLVPWSVVTPIGPDSLFAIGVFIGFTLSQTGIGPALAAS